MSLADHYQPIEATTSAQLSIDPQGGVRSERFDDIYFYPDRGADETRHVFIQGNTLPRRWRELKAEPFCIVELGFGTGLNFLVAADCWLDCTDTCDSSATLHYYSIEKYPLTHTALARVFRDCQFNFALADALLAQYPDPVSGEYCLRFRHSGREIVLTLLFGDALDALASLECYPHGDPTARGLQADAWFMDGFAPSQNGDMWGQQLCQQIALHSKPGTTVATFSVARSVRDNLSDAGFQLQKKPGFGNKREMLCGTLGDQGDGITGLPAQRHNNCFARHSSSSARQRIAVIGAGIAGTCTARLLAEAGQPVTVIDAAKEPASGASGNRRGILFARTGKQRSALGEWHEAAFHFAHNFYRGFESDNINGGLTGMLKLGESLPPTLANTNELRSRQQLSREQASARAGLCLRDGGIYYPQAGHLQPAAVCKTLLDNSRINYLGGRQLLSLTPATEPNSHWHLQLQSRDGETEQLEFDVVVICCGHQATQFDASSWLPVRPIRGQSSQLVSNQHTEQLAISICDKGYVAPAVDGLHDCGATFNLHEQSAETRAEDDKTNRANVAQCFTEQSYWSTGPRSDGARVGFRATTPDYLPIVGPLSDPDNFRQHFAMLGDNAKQAISVQAKNLPGLYVNSGYGSHGFTLAPLASYALAAEMLGRPLPISDRLRHAIAPNRFLLRGLIRQQPLGSTS